MKGKKVRVINGSWQGHHGEVLGYVRQRTFVLQMVLKVKLKNGVITHCYKKDLRDAPKIHEDAKTTGSVRNTE